MDCEVITVVAGGWSAGLVPKETLPGLIIGVNDAAMHLPKTDIIVSMDRHWTEQRWPVLLSKQLPFYVREAALKLIPERHEWMRVFQCDNETNRFSDDLTTLNGMNSGACAFNLAYQLRPKTIYLVGFDMRPGPHNESHWFPTYAWAQGKMKVKAVWADVNECARQCKEAGINVFIVGDWSAIKAFPRVDYEFMRM